MTRMDSFPRGAAAWSVLFATISILAFAVPAHAQVTSLVVDFDDTDYRVVEGESVTVTVTLTPAADREVVIPIAATSYMLASFPAETGDYTVTGLSSGNLTFAVGDASKTFVVTANEDTELVVDDVRLDFGTLPSGVTSSRQSETYRAVVRILDNDFTRTGNAREDQPRDWSFTLVRIGADPEGEDIIWWIEGPEARYFHVLPVVQGAYVYGLFLVRPETMPDRDVKDTYEFTFYYSDGNEQSGADPGCSQTTPSNCRPDYRGTIKVNITDAPEISLDPSSVPEETATDVGVSLFGFQANDMVTFSVGGQCGTDGILSLSNAPTVTIGTVGTATAMLSLTAGAVPRDTDCEVVATGTTVLWGRVDTVETTLTVESQATTPGAPTITGTAQVGQTLTADTTAIVDADGLTNVSYTYQWIRVATDNTETNISGATASTYTLVAADQGTTIKVRVSFTDDASNAETLTSTATAVVSAAPNTPATGAPTITGTAQVGQTLTADTTAIVDADGLTNVSYTYQWIRTDAGAPMTNIASATASTYTDWWRPTWARRSR